MDTKKFIAGTWQESNSYKNFLPNIINHSFTSSNSEIQTLLEKASFRCNHCQKGWLLEQHSELGEEEREAIHFLPEAAHVYMRCPFCGSPDFGLEKGRGVSIQSVELEIPND